ncbi:MAG: DUF3473 domain-containing protein [Rhodospirillales bacterium]
MTHSMHPVTVTLDLENHLGPQHAPRFEAPTQRILGLWAELGLQGTVFVVGELARQAPDLIKTIADAGHEIGYHSRNHRPLTDETPERLTHEAGDDKRWLEDITGQPVRGYRAPVMSLVRKSAWVTETLMELGFDYSSSVLPGWSPLYGFAEAPSTPFRWQSGLIELPAPVFKPGRLFARTALPYIGGIYLRYLPRAIIERAHRGLPTESSLPWAYIHPYDLDTDEPFRRMPDTALWVAILLWFNRRGTEKKFKRLFSGPNQFPTAGPLAERIDRELNTQALPVFDPGQII